MSAEITVNRKALRDYTVLEKFEAGIELRGTEVKSIRLGLVNLQGSYARVEGREIYLYDSDIQPYLRASHETHEPKRKRKLLMHRIQIEKIAVEIQQAGKTISALRMYWQKNHIKVELALGKGKAASDKRQDLKKRVEKREVDRMLADLQRKR